MKAFKKLGPAAGIITIGALMLDEPLRAQELNERRIAVSGGLGAAIDFNGTGGDGRNVGNETFVIPAVWAHVAFLPRGKVGLQVGVQSSKSAELRIVRGGSTGFVREIRHRDLFFTAEIRVHLVPVNRSGPILVVGWLIGAGRTAGTQLLMGLPPPPFSTPPVPTRIDRWTFEPGATTGFDLPAILNPNVALVGRLRARFMLRGGADRLNGFGWLGIDAGVGLETIF